ncbi:unnamed protein product [Caenorhabditis brenneri]
MVESLVNISIKRLEDCISRGFLHEFDCKLNAEQSNKLFAHYLKHPNKTDQNARWIQKFLHVTEVCLDGKTLDRRTRDAVKMLENLERFEIWELRSWSHFWLYGPGTEVRFAYVNLTTVLKELLSHDSMQRLTHLGVHAFETNLTDGWTMDLATLCPNLISLNINYCAPTMKDFKLLCEFLPSLKILTTSWGEILTLNNIGKLRDLEVFNTNETEFFRATDFQEIFDCQKLKILEIGGSDPDNDSQNLTYYLACEKVLPELQFLECSFNFITEEALEKVIHKHKKLQKIGLVGCALENRPQYSENNRKVTLLTIRDLHQCLNTLEHYSQEKFPRKIYFARILWKINQFVSTDYVNQKEEDLRRCFQMLCMVYEKYHGYDEVRGDAVTCLAHLCRDQRAKMFTYEEKQLLIRTILFQIPKFSEEDKSESPTYKISKGVYEILANDLILWNARRNLRALVKKVTPALLGDHTEPEPLKFVVKIVKSAFKLLSPRHQGALSNNNHIKAPLFEFLKLSSGQQELTKEILDLLQLLYIHRTEKYPLGRYHNPLSTTVIRDPRPLTDHVIVSKLPVVLAAHEDDYLTTMHILKFANDVVKYLQEDQVEKFMQERRFRPFEKLMTHGRYPEQFLAFSLIAHIHCRHRYFKAFSLPTFHEGFVEPLVIQLMDLMKIYNRRDDSPFLHVIQFLHDDSPFNDSKVFARWVFRHCPIMDPKILEENERRRLERRQRFIDRGV